MIKLTFQNFYFNDPSEFGHKLIKNFAYYVLMENTLDVNY